MGKWSIILLCLVPFVLGFGMGPFMNLFMPADTPPWVGWLFSFVGICGCFLFELVLLIKLQFPTLEKIHHWLHTVRGGAEYNMIAEVYDVVHQKILQKTDMICAEHTCLFHVDQSLLNGLGSKIDLMHQIVEHAKEFAAIRKLCCENVIGIDRQLEMIKVQINELAKGIYFVHSRSKIYLEDQYVVSQLLKKQSFRSTVCLDQDPGSQFGDLNYETFIAAQLEAAKKGVVVERLYILRTEKEFEDPRVRKHLDDIYQRGATQKAPIKILYIVLGPLTWKREQKERFENLDLVIVDGKRMSRGTIDPKLGIVKALYTGDELLLKEAVDDWNTLKKHAVEYGPPHTPALPATAPKGAPQT